MNIGIISAALSDVDAMTEFLSSIPNGDRLAKVLKVGKSASTRAYDDDSETARFVESDGRIAWCFTVTDITIDQAEMIAAQCVGIALGAKQFEAAVERALGSDFAREP